MENSDNISNIFYSEDKNHSYHYITSGNISFNENSSFFHPTVEAQKTPFDRFMKMALEGTSALEELIPAPKLIPEEE
jgi:hypothetical protein